MERAARLFRSKKVSGELMTDEDVARAAWRSAVGKFIAAHTGRLRLVRSTLVIEVSDAIWQKQLHGLSGQILSNLRKLTGPSAVDSLEFRVVAPRRQPGTEILAKLQPLFEAAVAEFESEGADFIRDPALRRVYELSRRQTARLATSNSKKTA